ncbi:hypothetical protein SeMB42_g03826 [Synchytrium endobioticum]|uniref:HTH APSES-type domain-containing protein n=1 Tax=Synchytrium endobioticum TaxID=286115 RepID=A0A507CLN2_9FUNG|nr:hypothetical protein SeLEV6574_g07432 [Synchytrium endobioticum]TPX46096.1 hypothetical protein SeMB42_g03826 [Synchytrium endobioticum]
MTDTSGLDSLAFLADVYRDASQQSQLNTANQIYQSASGALENMPTSFMAPPQNIPGQGLPLLAPAHPRVAGYDRLHLDESAPIRTPPSIDQEAFNGHSTSASNSAAFNTERKITLLPPRKPSNLSNSLTVSPSVSVPSVTLHPPTSAALSTTAASVPPATTALAAPTISHHAVYAAVYSGVPVYEMMCRNVAVMRRRADSFLNATQILKVAGIDKGRRTKILEREILVGEHEKVQGGYGKYQGTWIPFERGVLLARQYSVEGHLRPILEFQMPPVGRSDKTPTKEEYLAATRDKKPAASRQPSNSAATYRAVSAAISRNHGNEVTPYMSTSSTPLGTVSNTPAASPSSGPLRRKFRADEYSSVNIQQPELTGAERHRAALMALFLNEDKDHLPELLTNPAPPDLDVDLVIDDQGHTASHWAAALGRIPILRLLVEKGAHVKKLNNVGESALVRAVLVTNNFDNQTFPELLTILADAIPLVDNKHRTVLHHIAFTAGIKGRSLAAKYYMECVLERIGLMPGGFFATLIDIQDRHGDTALNIAARFGNRNLVEQLLDIGASPDMENKAGIRPVDFGIDDLLYHGESLRAATAAVRALAESMGDLLPGDENGGAGSVSMEGIISTNNSNSNNMRGSDDVVNTVSNIVNAVVGESLLANMDPTAATTPSMGDSTESRKRPRSPDGDGASGRLGFPPHELAALGMPVIKSKEVASAVEKMVEDMNSTFARDLRTKQEQLTETQSLLRELTRELAEVRRQNMLLRQQVAQLPDLAQKTKVLETALSEETARAQLIHGVSLADPSTATTNEAGTAGTSANTTNTTTPPMNVDELRKEVMSLRSVVHTHEVEEQKLREALAAMKATSSAEDALYRKIIALCTGIPQNQIDDEYVSNVLAAAETDKEIDTSTIASFMGRMRHHETSKSSSSTSAGNGNSGGGGGGVIGVANLRP